MSRKKIVLAYSGGLDTSVAIPWLQERYEADIVTMTIFITDVSNNTRFVELRKEFFREDSYPASTLVTVAALNRPEIMVEINGVAITPRPVLKPAKA